MTQTHLSHWPKGVPQSLPAATHTLDDNLRRSAERHPDKVALNFYGAATRYDELDQQVTDIAAYLQSVCGVQKGDRVGLYMQNAPQFVAGFYGVIRAGGVVVPINAMHLTDELAYICENAQIKTLLTAQDLVKNIMPLVASGTVKHVIAAHYAVALTGAHNGEQAGIDIPAVVKAPVIPLPDGITDWADMTSADVALAPVMLSPQDTCAIPYTSGSTGRAKGCVHTHQTALHGVDAIAHWFGYTGDEIHLGVTPMFHIVGLQGIMNVAISMGATIVIMSRWDRQSAARLIAQQGVTTWCTVPTAVIDLLNTPDLVPQDLSSLRLVYGGGSAMPEAVAERLNDMTGLEFIEVYGMTETMGPISHNALDEPKAGCVGMPVMDTVVHLLDPETQAPVAQGEVGEIAVSGPQVLLSYWQNPQADAESFVTIDGKRFLRTGDLARADTSGRLHIVDRLKRMINASGYKIWPAEVEARLYQHPAIAEVCVIGRKDAYRGETVKAVAVLKPGATLDAKDLTTWAQSQMAAYKVPRALEVVDSLPKSAAGKVLWQDLQARETSKDIS